ncbi:unnamed protein product [Malus baccata var. baccata]
MMQLAKLLYSRDFHITFVNTEFNHNCLIRSKGPDSVKGLPVFMFETIPNGLPPLDKDGTQDIPALYDSIKKTCFAATLTIPASPTIVASNSESFSTVTASIQPNPAFTQWYQQDQLVVSYITATLTELVLALTVSHDSVQAVWACLQRRFAHGSVTNSAALCYQLLDLSKGSKPVNEYLQHTKSLADKLIAIGRPVDPEDFITAVLRGLGSDYLTLITAIINVTHLPTFEELSTKIEAFDLQFPRPSPTPAATPTALITTQQPRASSHLSVVLGLVAPNTTSVVSNADGVLAAISTPIIRNLGMDLIFIPNNTGLGRLLFTIGLARVGPCRDGLYPLSLPSPQALAASSSILWHQRLGLSRSCIFIPVYEQWNTMTFINIIILYLLCSSFDYIFLQWTTSACGFMGYLQHNELVKRGMIPFKDENIRHDGTLDTPIDWIPGMKNVRLKDISNFIRVTDLSDIMFNYLGSEARNFLNSFSILFNIFDEFEHMFPNIYTIGPFNLLGRHFPESKSLNSSLWKEDTKCSEWLDKKKHNLVVYVNYGSITMMTDQHLIKFTWGLEYSKRPFLWIVRADVVNGDSPILPDEFFEEIKDRGYIAGWYAHDQVLAHPSVGVFLTHNGWNSTIESTSHGVPLICWPFFVEQQTNC